MLGIPLPQPGSFGYSASDMQYESKCPSAFKMAIALVAAVFFLAGCEETVTTVIPNAVPSFGDRTVADQSYTVGVEIGALTLPQASGGDGALTYTLSPDVSAFGLAFDGVTRRLTGTPTVAGVGVHALTYTATDADGDHASLTFSVNVAPDAVPSFGDRTVADQSYTVGVEIGALTLPQASGGDGALTYTLSPDVSAFGLAFDGVTRRLTGTPTVAGVGVHALTYTATDADGDHASLTFSVNVAPDAVPSFGDRTVADQSYTVGVEIGALTLPQASGGDGALTYTLSPDVSAFGLAFDGVTRRLTGTPTVAGVGVHALTYTATDADGDHASLTFSVNVAPDAVPSFGDRTVADQSYTVGVEIGALTLPQASGGNGALTYSLSPTVPGLRFDRDKRTFSGTPTVADTYRMTYTVVDSDANTNDSDAASQSFIITTVKPEGILSTYRGSGDQIFFLNPTGESVGDMLFTFLIGESPVEVNLISTNTTNSEMAPRIDRLDTVDVAASESPSVASVQHLSPAASTMHVLPWVVEFNNNPPRPLAVAGESRSYSIERRSVAAGDTFTFYNRDRYRELVEIHATARKVVTDGTVTLAVWVANENWGDCRECVSEIMIDALAARFLSPGRNNDIYDWLTAIFGDPWGPHAFSSLIPPEYADEIHILLCDLDEGVAGNFWGRNNYLRRSYSSERLMFYLDAPKFAQRDGPTWEVTDRKPSFLTLVLAHEFQSMIHFYQKLVKNDFEPVSEAWLNEMSSMVAEDLIANKIMADSRRGVAYDDPTAGSESGVRRGILPLYNKNNDLQAGTWGSGDQYYAFNYALGMYLALTYGGAALFGDIVRSDRSGIHAIEASLRDQGHVVSFEEVLLNWAVANLLSDSTEAPHPYRYNAGTWSTSQAGGEVFSLGSINLFNYRFYYGENGYLDGPRLYSLSEFARKGTQPPRSNRYVTLGLNTGAVRLRITAASGNRITVVIKE